MIVIIYRRIEIEYSSTRTQTNTVRGKGPGRVTGCSGRKRGIVRLPCSCSKDWVVSLLSFAPMTFDIFTFRGTVCEEEKSTVGIPYSDVEESGILPEFSLLDRAPGHNSDLCVIKVCNCGDQD